MDLSVSMKPSHVLKRLGTNITGISVYFPVLIMDMKMCKQISFQRETLSTGLTFMLLSCVNSTVSLQLRIGVEALTTDFTGESVVLNVSYMQL